MASLQNVLIVATLLALAGAQKPKNIGGDKTAAVDKVLEMLTGLQAKVVKEGEAEAKSYNVFACFCKSTQSKKQKVIVEETDTVAADSAEIGLLSSGRTTDDGDITENERVIEEEHGFIDSGATSNAQAIAAYATNIEDLTKAVSSIGSALKTLKSSMPSLLQLQSAHSGVREALAMADALGFGVEGAAAALLQGAPAVEMENYKVHSDGALTMLEGLQTSFRAAKNSADAAEVTRLANYHLAKQAHEDTIKSQTVEEVDTTKDKADKTAGIATSTAHMTEEQAALMTDTEYQNNVKTMCSKKALAYDQRVAVRSDELSALVAAIAIIKSTVLEKTTKATLRFAQRGVTVRLAQAVARDANAMSAVEAEAEEKDAAPKRALRGSHLYFLQSRSVSRHSSNDPINRASELLRKVAGKTHSTMLAGLVSSISTEAPVGRGMEKVKTLISELISRLQAGSAEEATQKGWCDKSLSNANTKKDVTTNAINEMTDEISKQNATVQILTQTLKKNEESIADLQAARTDAHTNRNKERLENKATVDEAQEGLAALNAAAGILSGFYNGAKDGGHEVYQPAPGSTDSAAEKDAPDADFGVNSGSQSASTGILAMLDVIKSDFVRTVKETQRAEVESVQDYTAFESQTVSTLTEQEAIFLNRGGEKTTAASRVQALETQLGTKESLLSSTNDELEDLRKSCIDTGMSAKERKENRQEEITALQKALCILGEDSIKCED